MQIDNETLEISYYALLAYAEKLEVDLRTRMGNHPNFGQEDVVFLRYTRKRVSKAIKVYLDGPQGHNLVRS